MHVDMSAIVGHGNTTDAWSNSCRQIFVVAGIELHLSAGAVPYTLLWTATTLAGMATLLAVVASTAEGLPTDAVTLKESDTAGYCRCL